MKQLNHRVRARRDLLDIWFHTSATWSADQADRYLTALDEAIQGLAAGTLRGVPHPSGYLRLRVGEHRIYYRESAQEVTIVRVLHPKQDVARHLRS